MALAFEVRVLLPADTTSTAAFFNDAAGFLAWNQGPCRSAVSVKNANFFDERWLAARLYD